MGLETRSRPRARHVLVVASAQDPRVSKLVNALRASGLHVILANTELLAAQASEVGACIFVLHPERWHETPAITTALQGNASYMIPLLVEPMALPEGSWATEPVNLQASIDETVQELVALISNHFQSLPDEEIDEEVQAEIIVPSLAEEAPVMPSPEEEEVIEQPAAVPHVQPPPIKAKPAPKFTLSTTVILFLAVILTVGLPAFFLSRQTADQTIYKNMTLKDTLLNRPYAAAVPGSRCDLGGARWAIGQYFNASSDTGTPQTVFDTSTEMACKADGLLMTKKDHFNYYATLVFEDRDSTALPRHFKTQITSTIVSSQQASIELGVRVQKPSGAASRGYGNDTLMVGEDGKWEVRRLNDTSSAVEAVLAHGSVQPAKTFTLAAEVNGPIMIFSINDHTVSTVSDATYQNSHGISFGIADPSAKSPFSALFAHFSYTPLASEP